MSTRILAYECDYCGALKKTKALIKRHEIACKQNPKCKNCLVCTHIDRSGEKPRCGLSGKLCSIAVSARCNDFNRRDSV